MHSKKTVIQLSIGRENTAKGTMNGTAAANTSLTQGALTERPQADKIFVRYFTLPKISGHELTA